MYESYQRRKYVLSTATTDDVLLLGGGGGGGGVGRHSSNKTELAVEGPAVATQRPTFVIAYLLNNNRRQKISS